MEKAVEMFKVPVETGTSAFAALLRQAGDEQPHRQSESSSFHGYGFPTFSSLSVTVPM